MLALDQTAVEGGRLAALTRDRPLYQPSHSEVLDGHRGTPETAPNRSVCLPCAYPCDVMPPCKNLSCWQINVFLRTELLGSWSARAGRSLDGAWRTGRSGSVAALEPITPHFSIV